MHDECKYNTYIYLLLSDAAMTGIGRVASWTTTLGAIRLALEVRVVTAFHKLTLVHIDDIFTTAEEKRISLVLSIKDALTIIKR